MARTNKLVAGSIGLDSVESNVVLENKIRSCLVRTCRQSLLRRYMQQHNEVELSALGMAITTVVTIAEILKNTGLATEKKVLTSTVGMKDESKGRVVQKARIEIVLGKTEKFDALVSANRSTKANGDGQERMRTLRNSRRMLHSVPQQTV